MPDYDVFKINQTRLGPAMLHSSFHFARFAQRSLWGAGLPVLLSACAALEPEGPPVAEKVWAVTATHQLIAFNAGQPRRILERKPLTGLTFGESIVGIDFRVARGVLYALADSGRLYTLDTASGALKAVGAPPPQWPGRGSVYGMDFNPAVDRIRVVTEAGRNLRLHPDTNAMVDFDPVTEGVQPDPDVAFDSSDPNAGKRPALVGAAYTYNKRDDKLTTNFALDRTTGALLTQGSREGQANAVHPNTGRLFTVGSLGLASFEDAAFDIADASNKALAAIRTTADSMTRLYTIDLVGGRATLVGTIGEGGALRGMAIEP